MNGPPPPGVKLLSIIVPVYNERATVLEVLARLAALDLPVRREVVVVDDGSTDGTGELLASLPAACDRVLIALERNGGKGRAVRAGLAAARGDWVFVQDADLELDPGELPRLLAAVRSGHEAVVGSRFLGNRPRWTSRAWWANRLLAAAANALFGARLTDPGSGHRLAPRALIEALGLEADGFDLEAEWSGKLLRRGVRIHEVAVGYRPRGRAEGKKVRWRDGIKAVRALLRARFAPAGRLFRAPRAPQALPGPASGFSA